MKAATPCRRNSHISNGISIHAAREGGDVADAEDVYDVNISIHAAREGGDKALRIKVTIISYFNPRRP